MLSRGVATIDIEMSSIDINQCDVDGAEEELGLDVFQGTHRCQPTTKASKYLKFSLSETFQRSFIPIIQNLMRI